MQLLRCLKMNRRSKRLDIYLLIASLLQIGFYAAWSLSPQNFGAIFYCDPRIGLFFIESVIRGAELTVPGLLQWFSAICLLVIALVLRGWPIIIGYLIFEIIASTPSLFFFVVIVFANLSPAHGFSVGELFFPVLTMILFSVVPLLIAVRIWRNGVAGG